MGAGDTSQAVGAGMERRGGRGGRASPRGTGEVVRWVIPWEPSRATLMIYHWIIVCVQRAYPLMKSLLRGVVEKVLAPES